MMAILTSVSYVIQRKALQKLHFLAIPFYFGLANGAVILSFFVTWQWQKVFSFDRYETDTVLLLFLVGLFSFLGHTCTSLAY